MNDPSLPTIDLHGLHLVRLVAAHGGMTAAAKAAGLSQSALTRQIQLIESRLGVTLFQRTTRRVTLTPAGSMLLRETEAVPGIMAGALRRLGEEFHGHTKEIRIGFSRSVSLAHLPGVLHGFVRRHPEVTVTVSHHAGSKVVEDVAASRLDVGVLCPPSRLPAGVEVTHRIADAFTIIAPHGHPVPAISADHGEWRGWAEAQAWIHPPACTRSRACIDAWWEKRGVTISPAMELDSFDMAIHLVALGLGTACVPRRAVSTFARKRRLQRVRLPEPLARELVVIVPRRGAVPDHIRDFVGSILF